MSEQDPFLSIGVLAHNEGSNIDIMLQSLFEQDAFQKFSTEVIIVANGCTDGTVTLATRSLAEHKTVWSNRGSAKVEELIVAGKANAWNQFVHKLSSPLASVLILIDADITFLNINTISALVVSLERACEAVVCVDRPVKDIKLSAKRTLVQNLLVAATSDIDLENVPLCGQLYCIRSVEARLIKLPVGISVEDGFLLALLRTCGFTRPDNPKRIILNSTVGHSFASVATLRELFKHEKWIVSGSIVNMLLFERFWKECTADCSAMMLMERWQENDPEWLPAFVKQQINERGWSLLPRHWWTRRWTRLCQLPIGQRLRSLPVAAIAATMDILVFVAAIRDVRYGRALRYWGRK